jgi:anti-sigma B factor antagonist
MVHGELDLATGPQLRAAVTWLVARGVRDVVMDLRALSFMDATGIGLLSSFAEQARHEGWQFTLTEAEGQVRRLLDVTAMRDRLPFAAAP